MDEKSRVKRLRLTSSHLHNTFPNFFESMGDGPSVPTPNLKTRAKRWSREGTVRISKVLRDNLVKENKEVRGGIRSYLLNDSTKLWQYRDVELHRWVYHF